jgi:GDP-L-fucose synthase
MNGEPTVTVWGTGKPRREFLHADDLASACYFLMENYNDPDIINIGVGKDISIGEMALLIKKITGFEGDIVFDTSMPDGTFQKLLDVNKLNNLGWHAGTGFEEGLRKTYEEKFLV